MAETEGAHAIGVMGSELEKRMIAETPLGRFRQPEEIAPVAVFLASGLWGWVTCESILASGGRWALPAASALDNDGVLPAAKKLDAKLIALAPHATGAEAQAQQGDTEYR